MIKTALSFVLLCLAPPSTVMAQDSVQLACSGVLKQGGIIACKGPANTRIELEGVKTRSAISNADGWVMFGLYRNETPEVTLRALGTEPISFVIRRRYDPKRNLRLNCDQIDARTPEQKKRAQEGQARFVEAFQRFHDSSEALSGFIMPTHGRISSKHGVRRRYHGVSQVTGEKCEKFGVHRGYDIAAPKGTPVLAPAGGTIIMADPEQYYAGQTVAIDHGLGIMSRLIHMSKIDVAVGDIVKQGDKIGEVGSTGRSTGPHLDWGVKWRDQTREDRSGDFYFDPALLLNWKGKVFGANPPLPPSPKTS